MADPTIKIDIIINDDGAAQKLKEIKSATEGVTSASDENRKSIDDFKSKFLDTYGLVDKQAKATEQSTVKLTEAVKVSSTEAVKASTAHRVLGEAHVAQSAAVTQSAKSTALSTEAWLAQQAVLQKASWEAAHAAAAMRDVGAAASAAGAAGSALTAATAAAAGALTAALAAGIAWAALLAQSTRHYFENAEATRDSRDAIEELGHTWERFQMVVGGAVLGSDFSIVKPIGMLQVAMDVLAVKIAVNIQMMKDFLSLIPGVSGLAGAVTRDVPQVNTTGGAAAGLQMWQNHVAEGGIMMPNTGEIERAFNEQESIRTKALEKAQREAEAWQKVNDQITGKTSISAAETWMKHVAQVGGVTKLTDGATQDLNAALSEALKSYDLLGKVAPKAMVDTWVATMQTLKVTDGLGNSILGEVLKNPTVPEIPVPSLPGMSAPGIFGEVLANPTVPALATVNPFRQAFTQLGQDLPHIIFGALQGGGDVIGSIGAGIGAQFSAQFQKARDRENTEFGKPITGSERAMGVAGAGVGAAFAGYDLGQKLGKGKGALSGAASGAAMGSVAGPWGTVIGAGIGAIAGYFGGKKKEKEAVQQMADQRAEMLEQFGGMAKLQEKAKSLGMDMAKAFSTKKPQEFRAEVEKLNAAMEAHAKTPQGMAEAQYKTIADMRTDAQQAVDIWQYMSTSGKYSADVVQQAWDAANSALVASGDKQALAAQAANTAVSDLSAKIQGLQASYANEAPEEVMGVLEANARAQVAALEEQRAAAQANIEAVKADLKPLIDGGIQIPIDFWVRTGAPGAPTVPQPGPNNGGGDYLSQEDRDRMAREAKGENNGFMNNAGKVLRDANGNVIGVAGGNPNDGREYHNGGLIRRMHSGGLMSDEVPIIGQTGEFVMSRRGVAAAGMRQLQRLNSGDSGSGGDSSLPLNVTIDGEVLARVILPGVIREAKRMGLYR